MTLKRKKGGRELLRKLPGRKGGGNKNCGAPISFLLTGFEEKKGREAKPQSEARAIAALGGSGKKRHYSPFRR